MPNIYSELVKLVKTNIKSGSNESHFAEDFKIALLPSNTRHSNVTIKQWHLTYFRPLITNTQYLHKYTVPLIIALVYYFWISDVFYLKSKTPFLAPNYQTHYYTNWKRVSRSSNNGITLIKICPFIKFFKKELRIQRTFKSYSFVYKIRPDYIQCQFVCISSTFLSVS